MSKFFVAAATLLAGVLVLPAASATLEDLRWNSRVLVLFAPAADNPVLVRQIEALRGAAAGLGERDLVVFAAAGSRILAVHGSAPSGETSASLAARLRPKDKAEVSAVLIGKDGGVKWRATAPFPIGAVFDTIDAMPMRRSEMR